MTGNDILLRLKEGHSVRVIEPLNTGLKKKNMLERISLIHKMDIFQHYSQICSSDFLVDLPIKLILCSLQKEQVYGIL